MCLVTYGKLLLLFVVLCVQAYGNEHCHPQKKVYIVRLSSVEEQFKKLAEARRKCLLEVTREPFPIQGVYCNKTFSNGICLPYTKAETEAVLPCPDYVHGFDTRGKAKSFCAADGTWLVKQKNGSAINFSDCTSYSKSDTDVIHISSAFKEHAHIIKILYDIGYAVSVASLVLAVFLMLVFRRLHCQRNTIHINLFVSFCLRAVICMVKDVNLIPQGDAFIENNELALNSSGSTWQCKAVQTMFHYLLTANYMWIFVEAFYLHTLIFFAMSSKKKKLFKFYIIFGWVSPVPSVLAWVIVRVNYADSLCWSTEQDGYNWITKGPIVLSIVVNFLLFLNIIRVVFTKLSEPVRCDPNRHRKLAKSTLVLIPLFGVYYIIFIAIPDCVDDSVQVVLLYIEITFSSFQGLVVALLFCFLNTEVKSEIKKAWQGHLTRRQSFLSKSNRSVTYVRDHSAKRINGGSDSLKPKYYGVNSTEDMQEMQTFTDQHDTPHKERQLYIDENNDVTLKVNGQVPHSSTLCEQFEEASKVM